MLDSAKPKTNEVQTAQAVDPAAICSAWTATSAALPQEIDAPYDLLWWWVPMVDEPVADWWDMPDDATHWMPWEPDMLPPPPPNGEMTSQQIERK